MHIIKKPLNRCSKPRFLIVLLSTGMLLGCGGSGGGSDQNDNNENDVSQPVAPVNSAPVAHITTEQTVNLNEQVFLYGDNSFDADGDNLTYQWTLLSSPTNSQIELSSLVNETVSFIPDVAGEYSVQLIVDDGLAESVPVIATVSAVTSLVDLTNAQFSNRVGGCNNYQGTYFSQVIDIQRAISFTGDLHISSDGVACSISSNNIPNHDFNDSSARFATNVSEQSVRYDVNLNPVVNTSVTWLELGVTNALFLNGVELDMLAAACYGVGNEPLGREKIGCGPDQIDNPWRYDPMSDLNNFGTDTHNAHVQPNGKYHYHGNPVAMFVQDCSVANQASPVIGFAADGFPIYGSCIEDEVNGGYRSAQSSYQLKNNGGPRESVDGYLTPSADQGEIASNNYDGQFRGDWQFKQGHGDLDECNGMTIDGQYGYYVTSRFPWVMNCFKGQVSSSFSNVGQALENKLHSH